MRSIVWFIPWMTVISASGCSTLNGSLQLGAGMGMLTGAAGVVAGNAAAGRSADLGDIAIGAGVGSALGLITSYLVHKSVESDRQSCEAESTEMHFGDLPPSPFIVPNPKKGSR